MSTHKYIKKPLVIEAIQWKGSNDKEVIDFCNGKAIIKNKTVILKTEVGKFPVIIGYYIIKGIDGEFSPCDPDVFIKKYEGID